MNFLLSFCQLGDGGCILFGQVHLFGSDLCLTLLCDWWLLLPSSRNSQSDPETAAHVLIPFQLTGQANQVGEEGQIPCDPHSQLLALCHWRQMPLFCYLHVCCVHFSLGTILENLRPAVPHLWWLLPLPSLICWRALLFVKSFCCHIPPLFAPISEPSHLWKAVLAVVDVLFYFYRFLSLYIIQSQCQWIETAGLLPPPDFLFLLHLMLNFLTRRLDWTTDSLEWSKWWCWTGRSPSLSLFPFPLTPPILTSSHGTPLAV